MFFGIYILGKKVEKRSKLLDYVVYWVVISIFGNKLKLELELGRVVGRGRVVRCNCK